MKVTHLRHFVAVAEELHFLRAADALGISRAKLDSSIRTLEAHVGSDLFDRRQESTALTAVGVALLDHARVELAEFDARPPGEKPRPRRAPVAPPREG